MLSLYQLLRIPLSCSAFPPWGWPGACRKGYLSPDCFYGNRPFPSNLKALAGSQR